MFNKPIDYIALVVFVFATYFFYRFYGETWKNT